MYPVQTVTPQADGSVVHIVKSGQTLWSIAIAYNTHIVDILNANNLPQSLEMVYNGQRLIIPIPAVQQKTPEPTPTYTQMVVNTEIPVKKQITPSSTTSNATVPQNKPTLIGNMKTETDGAQSKQMIQYGIGSAIVLGLFLIIIGAITSKKKNQG
jgi:LysM repeat protein